MSSVHPARPPLASREQNIRSSTDGLEARLGRITFTFKQAVQQQQPAATPAPTDDPSARQRLLNARRLIRCEWPGCPAVLASLTIYTNHLTSCHALSCNPVAPSLHTSLRAAFGGYECKLRPCTNQVHPDVLQLSKHLEASHVLPLCFTCPFNGCGAKAQTLDMVSLHLSTVHKTTPDKLPTTKFHEPTASYSEPPELPSLAERLQLPSWTMTTPMVLRYHKDLPQPAASTSRAPLTPEPSTQSTSNGLDSPSRGSDFPHSYEHLVYDRLDLPADGSWREPGVGVSFDADEPPPDFLGKGKGRAVAQFWEVRPVAEPDGLQLSAPPSNTFRPPAPPRAPTRSIFQAFRSEFMRKHPRAHEYAEDGEGDADDFDGDGWTSNWSFDGDTDGDDDPPPGSSRSGSGKPSRESTASTRRTGKKRKKRGW